MLILPSPGALRRGHDAEQARRNFPDFCRQAIKHASAEIGIDGDIKWSRYLDAIAVHLEAWANGEFRYLAINVKNKSFKSGLGSVMLPAWFWLHTPASQWLTGSARESLATEHCTASRRLLHSDWYQETLRELWGDEAWAFQGDQNAKQFVANDRGGHRYAFWIPNGTGKRANRIVIDDPLQIEEAHSPVANERANRWAMRTAVSRFNDPKTGGLCLIMHRLRRDDATGELREKFGEWFEGGKVVTLSLPLEYSAKRRTPATPIGWEDWRTEEGESLDEERWGEEQIEDDKIAFGPDYPGLCNQDPKDTGQRLVYPDWIQRWDDFPPWTDLRVVTSWDFSFEGMDPTKPKKTEKRSKCCGQVWAFSISKAYLLDQDLGHWDYIQQKEHFAAMLAKWPRAREHFVEAKANGVALVTEMSLEYPGIIPIHPDRRGSKYVRFAAVSRFYRAGDVLVPHDDAYDWVKSHVDTITTFPAVDYDEEVDCASQAISEVWLPEDGDDVRQALQEWRALADDE